MGHDSDDLIRQRAGVLAKDGGLMGIPHKELGKPLILLRICKALPLSSQLSLCESLFCRIFFRSLYSLSEDESSQTFFLFSSSLSLTTVENSARRFSEQVSASAEEELNSAILRDSSERNKRSGNNIKVWTCNISLLLASSGRLTRLRIKEQ